MMLAKSRLLGVFVAVISFFSLASIVTAQEQEEPSQYFRGNVIDIAQQSSIDVTEGLFIQKVEVKRSDTGEIVTVDWGSEFQPMPADQLLKEGQIVVLFEQIGPTGETEVVIADVYRMNAIYWLLGLFVVVVMIVAGFRGLASFLGMMVSLIVLLLYIVPNILSGSNPVFISLVGAAVIATITIYIAHGVSKKSHVALASMLTILLLVAGLAYMAVKAARLSGVGSEEAYFLQLSNTATINLQGLLLGGILLGALGVLDDITISQASIVAELKKAKPDISWHELYERALSIGKDHVASLVNTLVLAYAGANLPLFLLLIINKQSPLWVTLNSNMLVEEIIRTLAGSIGLVLAVPLSSFIAATVLSRGKITKKSNKAT